VDRLLNCLIGGVGIEFEQRTEAGCDRRSEMGDMVLLELVETDGPDEVDLDFVGNCDGMEELRAR
jgi:hypothetical protein